MMVFHESFFCLIESYSIATWPNELQRWTIIFFCLNICKNLTAHAIDFYRRMLSNSKWSLNWTMHFFHESFNKSWICARKKLAEMNHENSFFNWIQLLNIWMCRKHKTKMLRFQCPITSLNFCTQMRCSCLIQNLHCFGPTMWLNLLH